MVRIGPLSIGVLGLATIALLVPVAQGFTRAGGVESAQRGGARIAGLIGDPLGALGGFFRGFFTGGSGTTTPTTPTDPTRPAGTCREVSVFSTCGPNERSSGIPGLNKFCCSTGPTTTTGPTARPPVEFEPPFDPNPHNCNRGRGEIWRPEFNACLNDQEFREFQEEIRGTPRIIITPGATVDSIFHQLGILHPGGQSLAVTHNRLDVRAGDLGFQVRAFQAGHISQEDLRQGFRQAATVQ